ncbi:hypothetical protein JCM21900_000772 [Sporobolomyces salmonicolor]
MTLFCLGHPTVDAVTRKALQLPIINPFDRHGRIFFFAWLSFMLSFLSWYAMPPLLNITIRGDLNLTSNEIANSNIIAGVASLLVRLVAGPLCDKFGPRYVLVGTVWLSAIPCGLAGTVTSPLGLYFIRFFMGIAGAAFVPCQCLMAAWFDKSVIGTASAFAAGWGDAGVGVTFFVMPAVFNSFRSFHSDRIAWRLSFIVPCILLLVCGFAVLLLNDDTPMGSWADRNRPASDLCRGSTAAPVLRSTNSSMTVFGPPALASSSAAHSQNKIATASDAEKAQPGVEVTRRGSDGTVDSQATVVAPPPPPPPSFGAALKDLACPQTLMLAAAYFSTFGTALTVNSVLVSWYIRKFGWGQNEAGNWSAMFGLLNVVSRPCGGIVGDLLYRRFDVRRGVLAKKFWMSALCILGGAFALITGLVNPDSPGALIALVSVLAVFIEAGNGACYALLPHVNPHINGLMGGAVGGSGNLGGIIFSTIARFSSYERTIWIIGCVGIGIGALVSLINPSQRKTGTVYST